MAKLALLVVVSRSTLSSTWLLLGSSPVLVLALGWCSLRIAAVIGGGVAVVGCAVVMGVLQGVGCTVGPGGVTSQPRRLHPLRSPPFPSLWRRLAAALVAVAALVLSWCLVVAVVPIVAAPHEPLVLLWFPFPFRMRIRSGLCLLAPCA